VSVAKLDVRDAVASASPTVYDALETMKGVQVISPSLGFRVINTRGFANTTNVRFAQLVDGVDNQSPHIGAPMASALMPSDLDLLSVEVVAGVATALYGMNATNGLANFQTKNPFYSEGIGIRQQVAAYQFGSPHGADAELMSETSLRFAKAFSDKWAIKLNASYARGQDWVADDRTDLFPNGNGSAGLTGADNPAFDEVNGYGNESSNRKTLSLGGKNYVVARTGYREREVVDYQMQFLKGEAGIYFRPSANSEWSYTFRASNFDNVYQRSNRFRIKDYRLTQQVLQFKNPIFQARAYLTSENTGKSYNLRSMAENLDRHYKPDTDWYADYTTAFNAATVNGETVADAHRTARLAADEGRPQTGTDVFNALLDTLGDINNWDEGAALRVKAHLAHAEGMVSLGKLLGLKDADWQVGADYRDYIIVPDGNYFINPEEGDDNLNFYKAGAFTQIVRSFLNNKLRLSATLRVDKCRYFDPVWNPRLTAVYSLSADHNLRFSYQNGYRFPSIFEGYSNINSGGVKRVGGLRIMSEGIFENTWLKSSIDKFQAAVNTDVNTNGLTQADAIQKNKDMLKKNDYTYLKPEFMRSYELGYRGLFLKKRLFIDIDGYYNFYRNFMAQVEGSIPNTDLQPDIPTALFSRSTQFRYRLWTNSKTEVKNYGGSVEARYAIGENWVASANFTYATLQRTDRNDGLEDGFNTPEFAGNLGLNARNIAGHWGFGLTSRWQSSFLWQSFLVNGTVPAYHTLDGFVSYTFAQPKLTLKLGGTNLLNNYYTSMLGGPDMGGFYYGTVTCFF
ncbi:MAG: TonB-dependent receptor, partial [Saprospiraceae bacterium]|jgi:iron complex outermembrane receptor protein|nr:TonB-dependent receptor [Saprospiraceae bacterium]